MSYVLLSIKALVNITKKKKSTASFNVIGMNLESLKRTKKRRKKKLIVQQNHVYLNLVKNMFYVIIFAFMKYRPTKTSQIVKTERG